MSIISISPAALWRCIKGGSIRMMTKFILPNLTKAINTYLKLDPESKQRLKALRDKVITVELLPFHFIFQLECTEAGIKLHAEEALLAETKITGTPLQMLGMMINKDNRQQFFADDLKIEGNAELGQKVVELFDELNIDWEEYLSKFVGDVPAHHTGRVIRGISKWLVHAKETFADNINEYVHEEIQWFPSHEALKDFYIEIDNLRMDIDRMEARITRLKSALTNQENE